MEYRENALCYEDYCALRRSVGWTNFEENQTRKALGGRLYTVTAFDAGRVVGMGRLVGDGLYDTVVDVLVRPEYQGQGIGRSVMEQILAYAAAQTPAGGRTSVQLISEKGKEPFYAKLGFTPIPCESCGAGMRKVFRR